MPRVRPAPARWVPSGLLCALLAAPPALAGAPEVSAYPRSLMLGEGGRVEVRVRTGEDDPATLRAACNVGRFSAPKVSGSETRFTWTPPDVRYPHTALFAFWMEPGTGGVPDLAVLRVPLLGRTDLDVSTEPRADVLVEIGQKIFGPRKADGRGRVKVPVEVPPGVTRARVLSHYGNTSTAVETTLGVPATNPLLLVAGPDPMPRDGGWLWVLHTRKLEPGAVVVEAAGGEARLIEAQEDRALYELTAPSGSQRLSVNVRLPERPEATGAAALPVRDPLPRTLGPQPRRPPAAWGVGSSALAGGFFGGGSNLGGLLGVDLSLMPPILNGRTAFGGQLEVRSMRLATSITGLGTLESWVVGPSLAGVARFRAFEMGPLSVHLRAGAGLLVFWHQVSTGFQPTFTEVGLTVDAFAGAQLAYRLGPVDALLELRGELAPVQTARLNARMGGLVLAAGARVY